MEIINLRYGNVAHMEGGEMIARSCRSCKEIKEVSEFNKASRGYLGIATQCRECIAKYRKEKQVSRKEYNDKWRKENRDKYVAGNRAYYEKTQGTHAVRKRKWRQENPELDKAQQARRRARKKGLENDLTGYEIIELNGKFGGCALTGDADTHLDHVIPLATGYGGTTYSNMAPLRVDLNQSKNAKNIFEWFNDVKEREGLCEDKFAALILHLAGANGMSPEEYREHVYKCHKEAIE